MKLTQILSGMLIASVYAQDEAKKPLFTIRFNEFDDSEPPKEVASFIAQNEDGSFNVDDAKADNKVKYQQMSDKWMRKPNTERCWITKEEPQIARPTIETCMDPKKDNMGSVKECCNYVVDKEIAGDIEDFAVPKCSRYTRQEYNWKFFQCIPCNITSAYFTTVIDETEEAWNEIVEIYRVMWEKMGLTKHRLSNLLLPQITKPKDGEKADPNKKDEPKLRNGIVKVCASYMVKQWIDNRIIDPAANKSSSEEKADLEKFSKPTEAFDHCGIMDHKSVEAPAPPEPVALPSEFEPWSDAYKMLNWLQLFGYDGFQIVIVDDINIDKETGKSLSYDQTKNLNTNSAFNCFTMGNKEQSDFGYFKYEKYVTQSAMHSVVFGLTVAALSVSASLY